MSTEIENVEFEEVEDLEVAESDTEITEDWTEGPDEEEEEEDSDFDDEWEEEEDVVD